MRVQHRKSGPSLTQQGQKNDSDINVLVARYLRTGQADPRLVARKPVFGDFSSIDFQTMMNRVTQVQSEFRSLPSRIRARFGNEPFQLVRFVENPANRAEAVKLGLVQPTEKEVEDAVAADKAVKAAAAARRASEGVQVDLEEVIEDAPPAPVKAVKKKS